MPVINLFLVKELHEVEEKVYARGTFVQTQVLIKRVEPLVRSKLSRVWTATRLQLKTVFQHPHNSKDALDLSVYLTCMTQRPNTSARPTQRIRFSLAC